MKIAKKLLSIIAIMAVTLVAGLSSSVFAANGNATDEGGGGTPGCYVYKVNHGQISAKSTYDDTCFGGIWRKYDVNGNNSISIPNWGSVRGGTLSGCVDDGAESYYRLALVQFYTNGALNYSKFTPVMEGGGEKQVALWPGNDFAPAGGYVTYRGTDWNSIKEKFETAKQHGAHMDGHDWPNVSMFCYSESWDSPSTEFYSTSTVQVPEQNGVNNPGSSTSPEDGTTTYSVETIEETVTANFWHNITYKNGVANLPAGAVFDDVSTNWTVTETGGQNRGQIHSGTFTTNGKTTKTSENLGYDTVTVNGLVEGATVTICHTINYNHKNVTFTNTDGTNYRNPQYANQGSSKACLEIKRVEDPNKPAGEGGFWSTTTVTVPQQNDVPGYEATTGESKTDDREVDIKFSTDKDSVQVVFTHNMYYDDKLWSWSAYQGEPGKPVSSKDTFPDVCSTYDVTWEGDISGTVVSGQKFCTKSKSSGDVASTTTYTITGLQPDKPVTVCQKINHDKINVEMKRKAVYKRVCGLYSCWWEFDYWEYSEGSSSGTGYTKGCVTVTRPSEPEENENSITSGGVNNWIKYAGEVSTVGWNPKAISQASRRLAEYKAINYLVPARVQYYTDITKGNIGLVYPNRQNIEPCTYYRGKSETVWCDVLNDGKTPVLQSQLNLGPVRFPHTLTANAPIIGGSSASGRSATIATPDYVGYKYCNSFGYRWEYWYSITRNGNDDWQKETRVSDYWTNYNAACRTIAKKPSAAAWNGGVLTNGGITTSTSPRILGISETGPQAATPNQFNFVYGSWAEYLAVIGKESNLFASGDMFSRGSTSRDALTNSPLTIANSGSVGGSGITTSQALRTRLESYLMNHPTANLSDVYTPNATTKIVTTGSINIDRDIVYPTQNYTNIYQLPQNVIFVNGDVTIEPGVRRIDAWIIATGNINTCKVRESNKSTATVAVNYNRDTTCDQQLVFNGPVMAGSVSLNRTYGSDPKTGSDRYVPAEIFNLSAGTYLWAYAQAGRYDSSYTEAYSRELAPRY